jgi:hypothetical protein
MKSKLLNLQSTTYVWELAVCYESHCSAKHALALSHSCPCSIAFMLFALSHSCPCSVDMASVNVSTFHMYCRFTFLIYCVCVLCCHRRSVDGACRYRSFCCRIDNVELCRWRLPCALRIAVIFMILCTVLPYNCYRTYVVAHFVRFMLMFCASLQCLHCCPVFEFPVFASGLFSSSWCLC